VSDTRLSNEHAWAMQVVISYRLAYFQ